METKPYEYDRTVPWVPQQNQRYDGRYFTPRTTQQPVGAARSAQFIASSPPGVARGPKPRSPERMPKARALALARTLKKWITISSIVCFGTLSGLVALHQVGTTASHTNQPSSKSSQATATPSSSNGFLTNKEETTLDQVTLHRVPPTGPTILRRVPPAGLTTLPRHPSAGPASPDARHLCPRNHSQDCHWK